MTQSDTDKVDCPLCGLSVGKQGLGSHKNSKRCKVRQSLNEIQERNLQSVPNSSKIKDFLRESEFPLEKKAYRYNNKAFRRPRGDVVSRRFYTSEEGLKEAKKRILPAPNNNGFKAKIQKRLGDFWICRLVNASDVDRYGEEYAVVHVETEEDVSRRRTTYIRPNMNHAYTADGDRIGSALPISEAADEWGIDKSEAVAQVI